MHACTYACVIVCRAVRRLHGVGGGAGQFWPAEAARGGVGGQKNFFKDSEKISFYPQNFLMTFFKSSKIAKNNYAATMSSAARRQIIGGAPTNYRRRHADQQKSAAAATPTNCWRRQRSAAGA